MKTYRTTVSRRSGFTLIELLVAVGITAIMVAFILSITTNVLNLWTRTTGALTCENQAVLIMDYLTQDFRGIVMKHDTMLDDINGRNPTPGQNNLQYGKASVWLAATVQPNQRVTGDSKLPDANWDSTNAGIMKPQNGSATGPSLYFPPPPPAGHDPLLVDPNPQQGNPSTYRFGQAGVWLRFFTTAPDSGLSDAQGTDQVAGNVDDLAHSSAPRAVAYQIIRMQPTHGNKDVIRYLFFRSAVRPYSTDVGKNNGQKLSTFAVGYDLFTSYVDTIAKKEYNYNTPSAVSNLLGDAGNVRCPGVPGPNSQIYTTQLLANNVIDFGVRFWVRDTSQPANLGEQLPLKLAFPDPTVNGNKNLAFVVSTQDDKVAKASSVTQPQLPLYPPSQYTIVNTTWGFPMAVDIFVRILDDDGVRQIDAIENGILKPPSGMDPDAFWWETAEKHSLVYTRRIDLPTILKSPTFK